jgi:ribosome biogenesis SPOUT family RNA methylase Rps3
MESIKFIIEVCEPFISNWLLLEIKHSSIIVGKDKLLITNVKENYVQYLSKYGNVSSSSIIDLKDLHDKIIILDPLADLTLTPEEASNHMLVIGGILGDDPPRGRTFKYITSKLPNCKARNLGKKQFSIDGAIYVAKLINEGKKLEEIPIMENLVIKVDEFHEIILPYVYPLVNNKPLISDELIEYLKYYIEEDEEMLLSGKIPPLRY